MPRLPSVRNPFAKLVILVMIVFAALEVLTACSRTKHCPAFSDAAFDTWFPYKQDQQLVFMNSLRQKDTILIFHYDRSTSEAIKTGFLSGDCNIHAEIMGRGTTEGLSISCRLDDYGKRTYMSLGDFYFSGSTIGDTGIVKWGMDAVYKSAYYSSINLQGKVFTSVQLVEKDTTRVEREGSYRVYLSKENGTIAYEKYPSHELWVKQ